MRSKVVNMLVLALVLGGVGFSLAQQQQPRKARVEEEEDTPRKAKVKIVTAEKSKLEEMLEQALKHNPDIRVAAAKMSEAEAELNRTRLQTTQKVVALYYAIDTQKKVVEHQDTKFKRVQLLSQRGANAVTHEEFEEAKQALALAKAKLAELEAQLPALVGKMAAGEGKDAEYRLYLEWLDERREDLGFYPPAKALTRKAQETQKVQGPLAERMRKALETPIKADYQQARLSRVLMDLEKRTPGLLIHGAERFRDADVTLQLKEEMPVAAILQALGDYTDRTFVVRSYGILMTTKDLLPPGAMTIDEFLRQKPAVPDVRTNPMNTNAGALWNPPDDVEGTVKAIDSNGWLTISLKKTEGLLGGHTLHLYRSSDDKTEPLYLGPIRLVNIFPKGAPPFAHVQQAVEGPCAHAQPMGRLKATPKVGDKVTSKAPDDKKNPPKEFIEGQVINVDLESGLMTLTIGSDAGLAKGHTMELFRLNPWRENQSKYLGTIRVLEVKTHQAVAQPVGRLATPPTIGDRVASRIVEK